MDSDVQFLDNEKENVWRVLAVLGKRKDTLFFFGFFLHTISP